MIRDTFTPNQWPALPGLLDALPLGILLYNCKGECLAANTAAQGLLGRSSWDELNLAALGAAPNGSRAPKLVASVELPPQQTLSDGAPHTNQIFLEDGGRLKPLEMSAMAVETPTLEGICALVLLRDTTNEQHMQQRVEDLQRHLRRMMYNEPAQATPAGKPAADAGKVEALEQQLQETRAALETARRELAEAQTASTATGSAPSPAPAADERAMLQKRMATNEKLIALGENVAGIAHEINTPVSAVKAGIINILRSLPGVLPELMRLLNNLPDDVREAFIELMGEALRGRQPLSTREERQHRKQIKTQLDELDIPESLSKAKGLVEIQVFDNLPRFEALLKHPAATQMIQVCSRFSAFMKNATNVDTAASAIVRIVSAVKSFAYTQHEKKFVREDLAKSLETVLTVFHNALKYGVGVARNVPEDMPSVPVFPDEIQQVWGNLVNNAVQAMNGEGNLVIGLEFTEEEAIVRFTNDGPAISAENIERIWEPFFTTKAQGDGTGLGLSICRKIVEEGHGGRMEVSSQDGETCFTVRLPRYQPEDKMLEPAE